MLTKTLIDTRSADPVIVARARAYLAGMRAEFATAFPAAIARGGMPADADRDRLARRFQANGTALRQDLRQDLHQGTRRAVIETLAEELAGELATLRLI